MNSNKLTGTRILITGGTSGLGLELSKRLLEYGNTVYCTGRKPPTEIMQKKDFRFIPADFSDLRSLASVVRGIAGEGEKFNVIINNAGILSPPGFTITSDNYEYTFQVNYLAHLLVNEILIRAGSLSESGRIVSVTSPVYRLVKPHFRVPTGDSYNPVRAYSESKFYTLLTGRYLQKKFPGTEIQFFGFNPGTFRSGIARMQKEWFRRLYVFGAPFLRHPGSPASKLIQILSSENIIPGAVYTSVKRKQFPNESPEDNNYEAFLEQSSKILSAFTGYDGSTVN